MLLPTFDQLPTSMHFLSSVESKYHVLTMCKVVGSGCGVGCMICGVIVYRFNSVGYRVMCIFGGVEYLIRRTIMHGVECYLCIIGRLVTRMR